MTTLIGIAIWVIIFFVWYWKTYPEKVKNTLGIQQLNFKMPEIRRKKKRPAPTSVKKRKRADYKGLVSEVETICARDSMYASDAASLVESVMKLMEIEPASGQIWEAYALDTLERADITCDECGKQVAKTVKKTGIRLQCLGCRKELALRNSKVTIIDPNRPDLEEWEKPPRH